MLNVSSCPSGHNTPIPLKRSPPASFKRLLGGSRQLLAAELSSVMARMTFLKPRIITDCNHAKYGAPDLSITGSTVPARFDEGADCLI